MGIEVSKDHLDVAVRPCGRVFRVANTHEGIASLVDRLKADPPTLVVMEATGGFERGVAVALVDASVPIRVVEPSRARHFAKSPSKEENALSISTVSIVF